VNLLSHTTLFVKLADRLIMEQPITTAGAAFRVSSVPSISRISELEVVYAYICGSYIIADTIKIDAPSKHTNMAPDIEAAEHLLTLSREGTTSADVGEQPQAPGVRRPRR